MLERGSRALRCSRWPRAMVTPGASACRSANDLRFPELYRHYAAQGAELLLVPSAFTHTTGQAHWATLLRARAIENLAYVAGALPRVALHEKRPPHLGPQHGGRPLGARCWTCCPRARACVLGTNSTLQLLRLCCVSNCRRLSHQGVVTVSLSATPSRRAGMQLQCSAAASLWSAADRRLVVALLVHAGLAGRSLRGQPTAKQAWSATRPMPWATSVRELARNLQSLQALQFGRARWPGLAATARGHGAAARAPRAACASNGVTVTFFCPGPGAARPTALRVFEYAWCRRERAHTEVAQTCGAARRISGPAYSGSYYRAHDRWPAAWRSWSCVCPWPAPTGASWAIWSPPIPCRTCWTEVLAPPAAHAARRPGLHRGRRHSAWRIRGNARRGTSGVLGPATAGLAGQRPWCCAWTAGAVRARAAFPMC